MHVIKSVNTKYNAINMCSRLSTSHLGDRQQLGSGQYDMLRGRGVDLQLHIN